MSKELEYYFAYGSNLNSHQMRKRCSSATKVTVAILEDYKFTFPQYDFTLEGGGAGVIPMQGSRTEGVIYEISTEELLKLDQYEEIDDGYYRREELSLKTLDATPIKAWAYLPTERVDGQFHPPTDRYLNLIIDGAIENQLSQEYIEYLKSFTDS